MALGNVLPNPIRPVTTSERALIKDLVRVVKEREGSPAALVAAGRLSKLARQAPELDAAIDVEMNP